MKCQHFLLKKFIHNNCITINKFSRYAFKFFTLKLFADFTSPPVVFLKIFVFPNPALRFHSNFPNVRMNYRLGSILPMFIARKTKSYKTVKAINYN